MEENMDIRRRVEAKVERRWPMRGTPQSLRHAPASFCLMIECDERVTQADREDQLTAMRRLGSRP
jgi:hypothetical protein